MNERLSRIQNQFRRQADAYERLAGVRDEEGLRGIVMLSQVSPSEHALDVACGPGFLTMAFAASSGSAVGVDATDRFLDHARAETARRGLANVRFVAGDAERLPFADGSFDVAACRAAFHHFPNPGRVLSEMARVTRSAGRIVVADMLASEDSGKAELHNRIERLCDPTHVRALSESEFTRLFADAGLAMAFAGKRPLDYGLSEWMSHGGPSAADAKRIEELMASSLDVDRTGLAVRKEAGEIRFSHTGAAFLLVRP